jgi:hypothetical protein
LGFLLNIHFIIKNRVWLYWWSTLPGLEPASSWKCWEAAATPGLFSSEDSVAVLQPHHDSGGLSAAPETHRLVVGRSAHLKPYHYSWLPVAWITGESHISRLFQRVDIYKIIELFVHNSAGEWGATREWHVTSTNGRAKSGRLSSHWRIQVSEAKRIKMGQRLSRPFFMSVWSFQEKNMITCYQMTLCSQITQCYQIR